MIHGNKYNTTDLLKLILALDWLCENEDILDEICDLQEELSRDDDWGEDYDDPWR